MSWRRADDDERRAQARTLWRMSILGALALAALVGAGMWLEAHPDVQPGRGYAPVTAWRAR